MRSVTQDGIRRRWRHSLSVLYRTERPSTEGKRAGYLERSIRKDFPGRSVNADLFAVVTARNDDFPADFYRGLYRALPTDLLSFRILISRAT